MARIKGSMFIQWVKFIRTAEKAELQTWLTDAEKEVVTATLYPSSWYPFEVYRSVVEKIAQEFANNDEKVIFNWCFENAKIALRKLERAFDVADSPLETMEGYMKMLGWFFDTGKFGITVIDDQKIQVHIESFPPDFKIFCYIVRGWLAGVLSYADARDIKSKYIEKAWIGDPRTTIEYSWT
jgi:hypothetical protein